MSSRRSLAVSALVAAASLAVFAQARLTRNDADALQAKIDRIVARGLKPAPNRLSTIVTEGEVNSYLHYALGSTLPTGVVDPSVKILGDGRVSGSATVDLDAVRKDAKPSSALDPLNYLTGRVPLTATGVVTADNGVGRFTLESAAAGSVPIPKLLLQYVVSYYSRTPEDPDGIGLDDPFALPSRIRKITVERGRAIIVQ
jgi:hypothetical protein